MLRTRALRVAATLLAVTGLLGLAACGDDDEEEAEPTTAPEETTAGEADMTVVLSEFVVVPTPTEVAAGELTILADNQGGEVHELVIAKGDDPAALPIDADGAVDEASLPEGDLIGEIEEFAAQSQETAAFTLEPGSYVFFCNITEEEEDGEIESHFKLGMHAVVTVT